MMRPIVKGSTDQSVVIRIVDSTDGTPETGVVFNTSGIDLWYRREGATRTSITEATLSALNDAHSDGGILHIGDGYYRLDLPDAAVATGANGVMVGGTVTGMVVIGCYVPLFDVNPYDAVRMGMTALPNAAADAAGGLPISDAGGLDLDAQRSDVAAILVDTGTTLQGELDGIQADTEDIQARLPAALVSGRIDASVGAMAANVMTAAAAAADLTTELQSGLATAAALDAVDNFLDTEIAAIISTLGTPAGVSVSADIAAIKAETASILTDTAEIGAAGAGLTAINLPDQTMNITGNITGNLSGSVGSVTGAVGSVTAEVTPTAASKTGYRLSATGVDDVLDEVVLGSYTLRQLVRGLAAANLGKLSGAATTTITIRSADDTKDVVVATVDADGNRSAVTLDLA